MKSLLTVLILALASTVSFAQSGNDALEGTWSYSVETPDGTYTGQMVFTKSDDGYTGKLVTTNGSSNMENLKFEDNEVSFSTEAEGFYVSISGKVDGDSFSGEVAVEDQAFTITAKRE